ncbi:unnamed protein product [Prunus armeniaca]
MKFALRWVLVEDIRLLLAYVSSSSIHHVPWTADGVVDSIARYGRSQCFERRGVEVRRFMSRKARHKP